MIDTILGLTPAMEMAWAVFFGLTALAGWQIIEHINRKNMLKRMTSTHIAWHTLPSLGLKVGGGWLAAATSQHAVVGEGIFLGIELYLLSLFVWGISIGALLIHVGMESTIDSDKRLFK